MSASVQLNTMKKTILVVIWVFVALSTGLSTHIVGGEITYTCLGNNQYEVKLSVYRDCFNGVPPFDDPASLGVFTSNDSLLFAVDLVWNQLEDTLPIYLNNPCLVRPPDVCVHRTTYSTILDLPIRPGGYKLVYQRCCRNQLIRNVPDPEAVGITIISEIRDESLALCNSSAVYNYWPPLAICAHEPVDFDHSATDPEGDSLFYRLCTPLDGATPDDPMPQPPYAGPYLEVVWAPPYGLSNLLGGTPLAIDPDNGFMTGVPNTVGNFVVGVCVDEFRDGVLLSTTRRDFQYNVSDCGVPVAAFTAPVRQCNDLEVSFQNFTDLNDLGIVNWYFDWVNNPTVSSTEFSPTFTYPDTGRYEVALVINPGYSCSDTIVRTVWLTSTTANAALALNNRACDEDGLRIRAENLSTDSVHNLTSAQWLVTGPNNYQFTSTSLKPEFTVTDPGVYSVLLTVTSSNGCTDQISLPFDLPFGTSIDLSEELSICLGDSIGLYPDAPTGLVYSWAPNPDFSDLTHPNPIVAPDTTRWYQLQISDPDLPCIWEKEVQVQVLGDGLLTATANPTTILPGETSQLEALFPGPATFSWEPPLTLNDPSLINPTAQPTATTTYTVFATSSSGCVKTAQVQVVVLSPICGEPYVFFPTGFSPNGDGENEVLKMEGRFATEVYWMIFNRFGEKVFESNSLELSWDGTYKGVPQPPETYGYYYRIVCADGAVSEKKGNVTLLR
jgi:gliding motility-associated-like protein